MWPFGNDSSNTSSEATTPIEFVHRVSSRVKNVTIKIGKGGVVTVVSPPLVPSFFVTQFVEKNRAWIESKLSAIQKTRTEPNSVALFGKAYTKKIAYIPGKTLGIFVAGSEIIANTPEAAHGEVTWGKKQDLQLVRFLKSTASTYIVTRTAQIAEKMGIKYNGLTLREQSSRWGSCSSRGNLNFNWRLVHAETSVIDYVIVHELAHRVHMDHSRNFWNLVAKYDPDYQMHRGWLKRNGHGLF
jgi:predicted metal-dependent hydrolase